VLLTQEVCTQMRHAVDADYCGSFIVKGRTQPVAVYGLRAARISAGETEADLGETANPVAT
jgi:hypothetical protein